MRAVFWSSALTVGNVFALSDSTDSENNNSGTSYATDTSIGDGWITIPWNSTLLSYSMPSHIQSPTKYAKVTSTHSSAQSAPTYTHLPISSLASGGIPSNHLHSSTKHPSAVPHSQASTSHLAGHTTLPSTSTSSQTWTTVSTCSDPSTTSHNSPCIPCEGQPGSDPNAYCGYTINDNPYHVTPKTCRTVHYDFEITNTTISPDGFERIALLINGQMPGPMIEANWGDTIVVRVTNKMERNGTSLHWHGLRQFMTNEMDGTPSLTQCPIAPGDSMVYTYIATNFGTSWYHSHFGLQTYEGVFGPMIIQGPSALEYDEEQMIVLQDWSHSTINSRYAAAEDVPTGGPQTLDNGLINGLGVWNTDTFTGVTGSYFQMNVTSGKSYRLRVVNTGIQSTFKFHIDGHRFKVIAADFVPIEPYETDILNINTGQRYDLVMLADQPIGAYWMRSDNQEPCGQLHQPNTRGIVRYEGTAQLIPSSTAKSYTAECVDEPYESLVPIVPVNAGSRYDDLIDEMVLIGPNGGNPNLYKWTLSGTTFQSQWNEPTLKQIMDNGTVPNYSGDLAIQIPNLQEWVYVVIESPVPLPHPIHLHGHDFLVLAQGKGLYHNKVRLNTINPPRRDVAFMPWDPVNISGGYLVLAFETDNPGAWLLHCHVGWHISMGFALQIIENIDGIKQTVTNRSQIDQTCNNWRDYESESGVHVMDSGV